MSDCFIMLWLPRFTPCSGDDVKGHRLARRSSSSNLQAQSFMNLNHDILNQSKLLAVYTVT